jgi:hypothetical protein
MRTLHSRSAAFSLVILAVLAVLSCGADSRAESRRQRLNTFREVLPQDVRQEFDGIRHESQCVQVGTLLTQAREEDADLDASIDSIMHAELIDCFTDDEMVHFFWLYFAFSLEGNAVPDP